MPSGIDESPVKAAMDNLTDKTIVAVDDELGARELLKLLFELKGTTVYTAANYLQAMDIFERHDPDLMLIDLMMPDINGLTLCRDIRERSDVPIIIVTAKARSQEVVEGLRAGADDYVTKPYVPEVLLERARAVLRREDANKQSGVQDSLDDGYLRINLADQEIAVDGKPVRLSSTEYDLFVFLVRHRNQTCTFEQIMRYVWGQERAHRPEYIHVYIGRLRKKIERDPKDPVYIMTEHSTGYRFVFRT